MSRERDIRTGVKKLETVKRKPSQVEQNKKKSTLMIDYMTLNI